MPEDNYIPWSSYPYLRIARRQAVAYAEVLRVSDAIERRGGCRDTKLPFFVVDMIRDAANNEHNRRLRARTAS